MTSDQFSHYPGLPWLLVGTVDAGYVVFDTRTGERYSACCEDRIHQIAADLSGSKTHMGLGDLIHSVTKFFGVKRCSSCAQRQVAANRAAPKLWRRRGR